VEVEDVVSVSRRRSVSVGDVEIVLIALALVVQRRPIRIVKRESNMVATMQ